MLPLIKTKINQDRCVILILDLPLKFYCVNLLDQAKLFNGRASSCFAEDRRDFIDNYFFRNNQNQNSY